MAHTCHAIGCDTRVKPEMLMCHKHWFMIPRALRSAIWTTYRAGQCDDWRPSSAYCRNAKRAVKLVAEREGRTVTGQEDELRLYDLFDPKNHAAT